MEFIIGDENTSRDSILETKEKVRALIVTKDNKILIANYGGVTLLPGGSIEAEESIEEAILRELREEIGIDYESNELSKFVTVRYYQSSYPKRDGTTVSREVVTHYFVLHYRGINENNRNLTAEEQKDAFSLELVSFDDLNQRLATSNGTNPRTSFFNKELKMVLEAYLKEQKKATPKSRKRSYKSIANQGITN